MIHVIVNKQGVRFEVLLDDEDAPILQKHSWHVHDDGSGYLRVKSCVRRKANGKWKDGVIALYLHRVIMHAKRGIIIDHINGNGLDCRRSNLRACKHRANACNRKAHPGKKSKYKGVQWHAYKRGGGTWYVEIRRGHTRRVKSGFDTEEAAARAYDEMAIRLHGRFARLNFPQNTGNEDHKGKG